MKPLQILISVDQDVVPDHVARIIDWLSTYSHVELVLDDASARERSPEKESLLYRIFDRLDRKRTGLQPRVDRALASFELTNQPDSGIASANSGTEPDIVLSFDTRSRTSELPSRFGFWDCLLHNPAVESGNPPGFWEVLRRQPVSTVAVSVSMDGSAPRLLDTLEFRTDPTSPARNRDNHVRAACSLLARELEQLLINRISPLEFQRRLKEEPFPASLKPAPPTNLDMLRFFADQVRLLLSRRLGSASSPEQWSIGIVTGNPLTLSRTDLERVLWYEPPAGHFVADPFFINRGGSTFVFVEDFPYSAKHGHIACIAYRDRQFSEPRTVLAQPWHLSFPFVFEDDGMLYMVPEQAESGEIVLYACTRFPDHWERQRTLVPGFAGIDPVLFHHHDRWWLFATRADTVSTDNNLYLFFAPSLHEEFRPHPDNPVKTGLYGSRMAGRIIITDDRLFRPGQNCVPKYGASIVFHEIMELSESSYAEQYISELAPAAGTPFDRSLHTIDSNSGICVIDGTRLRR